IKDAFLSNADAFLSFMSKTETDPGFGKFFFSEMFRWYQDSVAGAGSARAGNGGPRAIHEHEPVRVTGDVDAEGYHIAKDTAGVVVGIYGDGAAYAVEIPELPGGPEVVTLKAGQIERIT
ncbi:MAG: hypothetical protein ACREE4_22150, partial [Stellaceae bacterium]